LYFHAIILSTPYIRHKIPAKDFLQTCVIKN
jgi:hypothetical protein